MLADAFSAYLMSLVNIQQEADENVRKYSIWSVNFMITASAINTKMLNPNFAIMCSPNAHEDSFDSTEPLYVMTREHYCTAFGLNFKLTFLISLLTSAPFLSTVDLTVPPTSFQCVH